MKKFNNLFYLTALFAAFSLFSCEGPMGPAGKDGTNGTDGIDGTNGTAVCQACHTNDQAMTAKVEQYNHSLHATGENAAYANRSGCTECHTSQGFLDYLADGTAEASYTNPLQPNCYTCHKIHTTFTVSDWSLTTTAAVALKHGSASYDKGASNICANCHQARAVSPIPTVGGADVTLGSRYGTHHGPVANMLLGKGGYEVVGTLSYGSNVHGSISDGCIKCHMSTPYGSYAGGHQMALEYDSHGTATPLFTGCTPCHDIASTTAPTFKTKVTTFQADIQSKLDALKALLITKGVYNSSTGLNNTGTFSADVAGAFLNYQTCLEDRSLGVHNPAYIKALIQNSIEKLSAK